MSQVGIFLKLNQYFFQFIFYSFTFLRTFAHQQCYSLFNFMIFYFILHNNTQKIILKMQQSPPHSPSRLPPRVSFTDTFDSTQQEQQEKHLMDRTLARGIIQNNASLIIQTQQVSGSVGEGPFNQEEQMKKIVFDYRSKYDRTRNETKAIQLKISILKEQMSRLHQKHQELQTNKRQIHSNYIDTEKDLQNFNFAVQKLQLRLDSGSHMQDRLKKDILYYKKLTYDLNLQLMKFKSEKKRFGNRSMREERMSLRCNTLLSSVEKTVNQNQQQRKKGVHQVKGVLVSKKEHLIKLRERDYNLQKSMMAALSQKLTEQKQLIHLFYANKFLKGLFHNKMEKLMSNYKQVNDAFSAIKQNTTVRNVDEFVIKFLKKNQIYGDLLQSISSLQPRIDELKEENTQLTHESLQLEHQKEEIQEIYKGLEHKKQNDLLSIVQQLNCKQQSLDKYRDSLTHWCISTISIFRAMPKREIRPKYEYLGDMLGDCLRILLKFVDTIQVKDISLAEQYLEKQANKNKIEAQDLIRRNFRIKTVGAQVTKEDDDVQYDLISEKDYLHMARRAVKKHYVGRGRQISRV